MKATIRCPGCGILIQIDPAAILGANAAGRPKRYSAEERERRRQRLAQIRNRRWPRSRPI